MSTVENFVAQVVASSVGSAKVFRICSSGQLSCSIDADGYNTLDECLVSMFNACQWKVKP